VNYNILYLKGEKENKMLSFLKKKKNSYMKIKSSYMKIKSLSFVIIS